jgi:hypothetical protein
MEADYAPPAVRLGDQVYWYSDPVTLADPCLAWVCLKPGALTVTLLVFAPNVGFIEKPSVRFKDDPGLRENPAWRQWGCWDFSPSSKELQRLQSVSANLAMNHERKAHQNANK